VLAEQAPTSKIEIRAGDRILTNQTAEKGAVRVLFVGNSLTYWNEMPWMVEEISAKGSPKLDTSFVGGSGMSLRQQWQMGKSVRAIREHAWDYVVLQGQSSEPANNADEFARYGRLLDAEIKKRGANTVFFLTWANRGEPQGPITDRYLRLAKEVGALVAPIGIAWQELAKEGLDLYDGSGVHPNLGGTYLSACVFYALFTGKSPVGLPHAFDVHFEIDEFYRRGLESERISTADALAIQRAAWAAVEKARS
jgi:hypothetical protein